MTGERQPPSQTQEGGWNRERSEPVAHPQQVGLSLSVML